MAHWFTSRSAMTRSNNIYSLYLLSRRPSALKTLRAKTQPTQFDMPINLETAKALGLRLAAQGMGTAHLNKAVRQLNERPRKAFRIETPAERSNKPS